MFKLYDIIKLKLNNAYHKDGNLLNRDIYITDLLHQSFQIIEANFNLVRIKGIKNDHIYKLSHDDLSDFELDTIFLRKEKLNKINETCLK